MKIAMFDVSPSEKKVVDKITAEQDIEFKLIDGDLTAESVDEVQGCDGVLAMQSGAIDDEIVYQKLQEFGIKSIGLRSVGTNIIDFALAKKHHLQVTHVPVYSPRAIAEMAVTQAMFLLRKIGIFESRMQKKSDFTRPDELISDEIYNQTVGLIGVGNIGSAVAQIFSAMGAKVIAYDLVHNPANEPYLTYASFDEVIKESDIISLHTPLLPSTKNMIGAKEFKQMKNTAYLINAARGGLVDTQALITALKEHEIAGAGLDTLADEASYFGKKVASNQVPEDYRELSAMDNVIITPHSAYFTKTSVRNMVEISLKDTIAIATGKRALYLVQG